jgi:hypothetical protein
VSHETIADSPVVVEFLCPGCCPDRDFFSDLISTSWCGNHAPSAVGMEDERQTTSGTQPPRSILAGGHVNRVACDFFHRKVELPLPENVPDDPPFQPWREGDSTSGTSHGHGCTCCERVSSNPWLG